MRVGAALERMYSFFVRDILRSEDDCQASTSGNVLSGLPSKGKENREWGCSGVPV